MREFEVPAFFLRLEGVNLDNILSDTQDLSTNRGSSLMLLRVVDEVGNRLAMEAGDLAISALEPVTTGASIGLWTFEAETTVQAEAVGNRVRNLLSGRGGGGYALRIAQHATFVVDVVSAPNNGDYVGARELAIAANRWRQMQEPSVVYPECPEVDGDMNGRSEHAERVCALDLKRPAMRGDTGTIAKQRIKGAEVAVSRSVYQRRMFGLEQKQEFYVDELRRAQKTIPDAITDLGLHAFAYHFGSICEQQHAGLRPSLRDKIAVFYADGNRVSKLQNEELKTAVDPVRRQIEIDYALKTNRRGFLARLLQTLVDTGAIGPPTDEELAERDAKSVRLADQVVRLETLLWGGDELMFVLPARLGFEVAEGFMDESATWKIGESQLHHGMALIFCHHDAPISRIRSLAHGHLADISKAVSREDSLLMPMVLESFDHVGSDPDGYWRKRLPWGLTNRHLVLSPQALGHMRSVARCLATGCGGAHTPLARRQLKRVAYAIGRSHCIEGSGVTAAIAGLEMENARLFEAASVAQAVVEIAPGSSLAPPVLEIVRKAAFWLSLDDLWDYLLPLKSTEEVA